MRRTHSAVPDYPELRGIEKFRAPKGARLYRGTILNPKSATECEFFRDGGLAVDRRGDVVALGDFDYIRGRLANGFAIIDETQHGERPVITPAFSDVHLHWVQEDARQGHLDKLEETLRPWLEKKIWPEEGRFADPMYAQKKAREFFSELARLGTVVAGIYSSVHEAAIRAAFDEVVGHAVIGNVLMTQNSPEYLLQKPEDAVALTRRMALEFGTSYAVTPRFAPTCEMKVMQDVGNIALRYRTWIQTHLAETRGSCPEENEIAWVKALFPTAASYTDVYARAGLLGPRTIMGHCIHMDDTEWKALAASGTAVAHCPTSNERLGSGRMPLETVREHGIRFALATDIGAGPSLSMLDPMRAFLKVHQGHAHVEPREALYRGTLAGAEILGLRGTAGNLNPGNEANFVMMKSPGTVSPDSPDKFISAILAGTRADFEQMVQRTFVKGRMVAGAPL